MNRSEGRMNPKMVSSIVSLIPERVARALSGTRFGVADARARNGEQVAHLARYLQWLSPLSPISKEDQSALGIASPHAKPAREGEGLEDDDEGPDPSGPDHPSVVG